MFHTLQLPSGFRGVIIMLNPILISSIYDFDSQVKRKRNITSNYSAKTYFQIGT